jgi:hypothetical protein
MVLVERVHIQRHLAEIAEHCQTRSDNEIYKVTLALGQILGREERWGGESKIFRTSVKTMGGRRRQEGLTPMPMHMQAYLLGSIA